MRNIVLTGFMGTGKTEVGRELVKLRGLKLIDLDSEIEQSEKMTISEIFKRFGEQKFRELESEMVEKISREQNVVISTGGGTVLRQQNMEALKNTGTVVCLTASPETILERTGSSDDRPLLLVDNPLEKIRELLQFRMPFYAKAHLMIDTEDKTPLRIAEEIIEKIQNSQVE